MKLPDDLERMFAELEAEADNPPETMPEPTPDRSLPYKSGFPTRYTQEWTRPDGDWDKDFERAKATIKDNGLIAIIGKRGTGKTRLAAEVMRDTYRAKGIYTTAMGIFLRIRASYNSKSESELEIIKELSRAPLLVLDELQERGNNEWEDRLLTHILDNRYGNLRPTILIANLAKPDLIANLGPSITSRMCETGGVIEMNGKSFRNKNADVDAPAHE